MSARKLLMIPGPIEFNSEVLQAMARPTPSHMAPDFSEEFGQALERMREIWLAPSGQPFVVAGSGTLAMDLAVANHTVHGNHAALSKIYYNDGKRFENARIEEIPTMEQHGSNKENRGQINNRPWIQTYEPS